MKYWGETAAGSAGPDRAPTTTYCLIVSEGRHLRVGTLGFTTTCKSLTVGTDSKAGWIIHDGGVSTFANDGIFLKKGYFAFNAYGWNGSGNVTTKGKMTVLSTVSAPALINCKQQPYWGNTYTISDAFIGAVGTCVEFGKGDQEGPSNTTYVVNDPSQYKGSVIETAQFPLNGSAYFGTRLKLGTMTTTGDLTLKTVGCVIGANTAADTVTFANVTIPSGCRIEVPISGASAGCIKATSSMNIASGTEIKFDTQYASAGEYVLLEGPTTSTFTEKDFTILTHDCMYAEHSLKVVSDATSRRLVLSLTYDYVIQTVSDNYIKGGNFKTPFRLIL